MSRLTLLAAILAALTLGCGDNHEHGDHDDSEGTGGETTKAPDPVTETDTDENEADDDEADDEIETSISMLEEDDQKLARAQKICPVSDQALGSMGIPIKLEVKGKTVFLCCRGCEKRILADPDKYLAKLK